LARSTSKRWRWDEPGPQCPEEKASKSKAREDASYENKEVGSKRRLGTVDGTAKAKPVVPRTFQA